jgi:hypothetical protein
MAEQKHLEGAMSFAYYFLPQNKTKLTLIGENHTNNFACDADKHTTTIANHVLGVLQQDPKHTSLILEIPPWQPLEEVQLNSHSTMAILAHPDTQKIYRQIMGFDWRNAWFPSVTIKDKLFKDNTLAMDITSEQGLYPFVYDAEYMLVTYISPIDLYGHQFFRIQEPDLYTQDDLIYLTHTYLENLVAEKTRVAQMIRTDWNPPVVKVQKRGKAKQILRNKMIEKRIEILRNLRHLWKMVADWNLLVILLAKEQCTSKIVICGEQHALHLDEILHSFRSGPRQTGTPQECVRLFQSDRI